jgi:hypothetical protein
VQALAEYRVAVLVLAIVADIVRDDVVERAVRGSGPEIVFGAFVLAAGTKMSTYTSTAWPSASSTLVRDDVPLPGFPASVPTVATSLSVTVTVNS